MLAYKPLQYGKNPANLLSTSKSTTTVAAPPVSIDCERIIELLTLV